MRVWRSLKFKLCKTSDVCWGRTQQKTISEQSTTAWFSSCTDILSGNSFFSAEDLLSDRLVTATCETASLVARPVAMAFAMVPHPRNPTATDEAEDVEASDMLDRLDRGGILGEKV